jgi:hypothetical protein
MEPTYFNRFMTIDNIKYDAIGCINHIGDDVNLGHYIYLTLNYHNNIQLRDDAQIKNSSYHWNNLMQCISNEYRFKYSIEKQNSDV